MSLSAKIRRAPMRVVTGAFILNSGISKFGVDDDTAKTLHGTAGTTYDVVRNMDPKTFSKALAAGEVAIGALVLAPIVPPVVAGAALMGFSGLLLNMWWNTPGMHEEGSPRPTPQGTGIAKDVWMFGIGTGLVLDGLLEPAHDKKLELVAATAEKTSKKREQAKTARKAAKAAAKTSSKQAKVAAGVGAAALAKAKDHDDAKLGRRARKAAEQARKAAEEAAERADVVKRAQLAAAVAAERARSARDEYGPVAVEKARAAAAAARQAADEYGPVVAERAKQAQERARDLAGEYGPVVAERARELVDDYGPVAAARARQAQAVAREKVERARAAVASATAG